MHLDIIPAPFPAFEALVDTHVAFCDGTAPVESCHRLPVSALFAPEITVWGAFEDGALIGIGALKQLSAADGEIKSMHTLATARGKGAARAILCAIIDTARQRGLTALWLETGVHPDFAAARALYAAHEFVETVPFGDYVPDPHSTFMTLDLRAAVPDAETATETPA
ncbi:GNAT family N-acetyltransferase [Sagittula salina]|uniref:GNAT family N-acetyltransferase n=1 Tax=Sagittula salina TaxID=2820268 RepID=A0A940MMZ0_9RHOB|nr:GNAT family N-acetyltransferase [Sagittula salina]MBP0482503.1 GNAT family N-acetyltransferase [Sagittula salina]